MHKKTISRENDKGLNAILAWSEVIIEPLWRLQFTLHGCDAEFDMPTQ